jgi:hypothetical protein
MNIDSMKQIRQINNWTKLLIFRISLYFKDFNH